MTSDRDWTEDFHHENGQYMNVCIKCEQTFIGYKRRFICKLCYTPLETGEHL
jgi:RNase P subunit RPR2